MIRSRRARPRRHRALATTRGQLAGAAAAVALVGALLVPAVAQAGDAEAARAAVAMSASVPLASSAPLGVGLTASPGTSVAARSGTAFDVDPLAPGGSYQADLAVSPATDVQLAHAVTLPVVDAASVGLYQESQVRRQADGDHYGLMLVVRHHGHVVLRLDRVTGGERVALARSGKVGAFVAGQELRAEVRVVGTAPVVLAARVWNDGQPVPDWQLTAVDDADDRIPDAGGLRVSGYLSSSATPRALTVSDVAAWGLSGDGAGEPSATPTPEPSASVTAEPTAEPSASVTAEPTPEPSASVTAEPTPEPTAEPSATPDPEPSATPTVEPSAPEPTASPSASVVAPTSSPAGFVHPGIMTSAAQLALVRGKVAARAEPWYSAYLRASSSKYGSLSWQPQPVAVVGCGAWNRINEGCTAETEDAQAAYTHALLYAYAGDRRHADKAIEILDAWSATLTGHRFDTTTYTNGRLQAAWAGSVFPKAAEIIRYSDAGWSSAGVDRFSRMLREAFLPMVRDGWTGGGANWQLSMAEATTSIGVFLDDRAVFEDGVGDWRRQVPATIYLSSDGPRPLLPPGTVIRAEGLDQYWKWPSRYVDGLQGETCRDADHMTMGIAAAVDVAETASIQGVDLYGEQRERLVAGMEYNTRFLNDPGAAGWVCPAPLKLIGTASRLGWEVGYHHYAVVEGVPMPETRRHVEATRPKNRSELFMNWTTLTHGS